MRVGWGKLKELTFSAQLIRKGIVLCLYVYNFVLFSPQSYKVGVLILHKCGNSLKEV